MENFTTDEKRVFELRLAVENQLRARVLEAIQVILEEELESALGCKRYERCYLNRKDKLHTISC